MAKAPRRRSTKFDAAGEAKRLYFVLLRKGELAAAAQVLGRLMSNNDPEPEKPNAGIDVDLLTEAEFEELGTIIQTMEEFKTRVHLRLGTQTTPAPVAWIDAPPPTSNPVVTAAAEPIADEPAFVLDEDEIELPDAEDL